MKRFRSFDEPIPHAFSQAEIIGMDNADLVSAINSAGSWEPELLEELIWRAFPDYDDPWEVGDEICYKAAEALGFSI